MEREGGEGGLNVAEAQSATEATQRAVKARELSIEACCISEDMKFPVKYMQRRKKQGMGWVFYLADDSLAAAVEPFLISQSQQPGAFCWRDKVHWLPPPNP